MKQKIYRAGMVPFFVKDDGTILMNFMVPSDQTYGGSDPQFCKGRIENGENHEDAAVREAEEELGLKEENVKWYYYLGQYLGRTHLYICEVGDMENFNEPHYETESTHWMTLEEFQEVGRELHRPVIREAYTTFVQIVNTDESFEEIETH